MTILEYLIRKISYNGLLNNRVATHKSQQTNRLKQNVGSTGSTHEVVLYQMTYLHFAAVYKNTAACELLLRYGANYKLQTGDKVECCNGVTAEHIYPIIKDIRQGLPKIKLLGQAMLSTLKQTQLHNKNALVLVQFS